MLLFSALLRRAAPEVRLRHPAPLQQRSAVDSLSRRSQIIRIVASWRVDPSIERMDAPGSLEEIFGWRERESTLWRGGMHKGKKRRYGQAVREETDAHAALGNSIASSSELLLLPLDSPT